MTRIIIDSTIDLPEQYRRQVHIVPLTIHFGTEELLDGVDIDRQRFYERLVESDVLPTTSQPSPDAFAQLFDQVEAAGDSAVVLTISHKLSGTYRRRGTGEYLRGGHHVRLHRLRYPGPVRH